MDFTDTSPIEGAGAALQTAVEQTALNYDATAAAANNVASMITTLLGSFIGIAITIVILALFGYLLRYVFSQDDSPGAHAGIRGATRAVIALFLMTSIWSVIRLMQTVADISPGVAYAVVLLSILTFFFWSLFALGETLVAGISAVVGWVADGLIIALKEISVCRHRDRPPSRDRQPRHREIDCIPDTRTDRCLSFSGGYRLSFTPPSLISPDYAACLR